MPARANRPESDPLAGQALTAHLNDPADAHDASAISFDPAAGIAATNVQAAINEMATGITEALAGKVSTTGGGMEGLAQASVDAGGYLLDLADGNVHDLTLTDDAPINLGSAQDGRACTVTLLLRQDASGGHEVTWPGSVEWVGGSEPVLQADPEAVDVVTLLSVDGGTTWLGFHAAGGGGGAESDPVASAALADHLADATDAHDAAAISFAPAGSIAAQNVQAAIEEVAAEASGGGAPSGPAGGVLSGSYPNPGLAPALQPSYKTGEYYACRGTLSGAGSGAMTLNRVYYLPLVVFKTQSFDRIAVQISANGAAGAVTRLGIFRDNGSGHPGTLVLDAGTVATDTGAGSIRAITISQQLTPGFYWLAAKPEGAGSATYTRIVPIADGGYLTAGFSGNVIYSDPGAGAFASNPTGLAAAALNPPVVALRAA